MNGRLKHRHRALPRREYVSDVEARNVNESNDSIHGTYQRSIESGIRQFLLCVTVKND